MASIQYSDVTDVVPLPIDAQDVVTKVHLVLAGNRAGKDPLRFEFRGQSGNTDHPNELLSYFARPIIYTYEAPEHSTYGCERSFDLDPGVELYLPPEHEDIPEPTTTNVTNAGDPSAVRDGDPTTYATVASVGTTGLIDYDFNEDAVGFYIRCEVSGADPHVLTSAGRGPGGFNMFAVHGISAGEQATEAYAVIPHDARVDDINTPGLPNAPEMLVRLVIPSAVTAIKVYEFYPLVPDEVKLLDIAKSNVRLPASEPKRVTVRGYVAPDREHTIVGWPGGDFTGTVAQHQYELGRTVIDFEQAGAPTGLSAVSMQEARRQQVAVDRALQKALYPVRMGERQ